MNEIDIWRSAHLLMKHHGEDAAFIAAQRADALLIGGDTRGGADWIKIFSAIENLERRKPREGEAVH